MMRLNLNPLKAFLKSSLKIDRELLTCPLITRSNDTTDYFAFALISLLYGLCRKREVNSEGLKEHATENQQRNENTRNTMHG